MQHGIGLEPISAARAHGPATFRACLRLAALLTCLSAQARAEDGQPGLLSEEEYLREMPIILSASRLPQSIPDAPNAVTVIDRQMIRESGFRRLADLFRLVPGFSVGNFNGHTASVTYHGLADQFARRLQVLVDGRSVYTSFFLGGVDWANLPVAMEDIERIEVVRGPNAVTFGANAFSASINIITRHASEAPGPSLSIAQGEDGIDDKLFRFAGGDDRLRYRVTAAGRADQGFDNVYDSHRMGFVSARVDYALPGKGELTALLGYYQAREEEGFIGDLVQRPHQRRPQGYHVHLRWQQLTEAGNEFVLQYYHTEDRTREEWAIPFPPFPTATADINRASWRDDLEFQHTVAVSPEARAVWGAELREDKVESRRIFGTPSPQRARLARGFGNLEWRAVESLAINAGAMLEDHTLTGSHVSPRLAANLRVHPGHTLRASFSRAYREPQLFEERSDLSVRLGPFRDQVLLSSGNLQPESIESRELGYVAELFERRLFLDARIYRDKASALIFDSNATKIVFPVGDARDNFDRQALDFRNADQVRIHGWEAALDLRVNRKARLWFQYAKTRIEAQDLLANYSRSAPRDSYGLLASWSPGRCLTGSAGYFRQSAMEWLGDGDLIAAHDRLDLRFACAFKVQGAPAELAIIAQGMEEAYVDFRPENRFTRQAFVTFRLGL